MTKLEPRLFTIQKAAAFLGVNVNTIRNWAKCGVLQGVKVGSRGDWRFTEESLLAMIQQPDLRSQDNADQYRLAAIVASSDDAIISKNLDGIVTSWNQAAERIFGYTQEEALGKEIKTLIIPRERWQEEDEILRQLRQGNRIDHFETRRVRKDGTPIPVSVTISPIRDDTGNIIGASKIARDMTEATRMQQHIAYLASLVEASADAIWGMSLDGTINSWNASAEKLYGYNAQEVIGKPMTMLVPTDQVSELHELSQQIASGLQVINHETQRITADGRRIDVSVSMAPIKTVMGEISGISLAARDITALKQLEKTKEEFISAASHELKTPLTSQKLLLQLLQRELEKFPNALLERYLARILKQNERMTHLINEMLTVVRMEAEQLQLHLAPGLLLEQVREVVNELAPAFSSHHFIVEGTQTQLVDLDQERIREVISDLLMNAVKYSPKADRVVICLSENTNTVTLSVQDFGIGIARADQKRIFDKFFRVSGEREQTYPGLGMGLYIAAQIVARHHGTLRVESELGKGATFYMCLPVYQSKKRG